MLLIASVAQVMWRVQGACRVGAEQSKSVETAIKMILIILKYLIVQSSIYCAGASLFLFWH